MKRKHNLLVYMNRLQNRFQSVTYHKNLKNILIMPIGLYQKVKIKKKTDNMIGSVQVLRHKGMGDGGLGLK